jgi:hypothetical protein
MEPVKISEKSLNFYQTTRREFSDNIHIYILLRKNLKLHKNASKKYESAVDLEGRQVNNCTVEQRIIEEHRNGSECAGI